jgi:hypothetical protein
MMNNIISQIANDPNIAADFKKVLQKHICSDCGIVIEDAGQEVKYLDKKTFCEDCYWERYHEAQEMKAEMRQEEDLLRRDMASEIGGR